MSNQYSMGRSKKFKIDKWSPIWKYATRIPQHPRGRGLYGNVTFAMHTIEALITK